MYFKQIELFGFKSFADKTQVNLEPGITAIVGPNGCGKSNILDALRWALGEQSPKALRGAHMQDVIFNGSEHRAATGMAEVTLTFDNADFRLPLDFAEVQVSRRVYRSGESEYLINKSPCRLRDVQELFMDTGIGTNAYSLIGQGKIDLVLSSKPDDRRYLFEEAAGIIKYKSRKRVAMRKLDSAEQNLLRLADIIGEVKRQMRSLKRQVNAAIRHRELTELLRELEIRNAWLRYNELSGQITDLKNKFTTAQDAYEKAEAESSQSEAEAEKLNLKRIELERVLMARRDSEYSVDSEMEKLEGQIALTGKEIEFSITQQNTAEKEEEEFKARAAELEAAHGNTEAQGNELRSKLTSAETELNEKQAAFDAAEQRVAEAEEAVEAMRAQTLETINTRNKAQTELETVAVGLSNIDTQLNAIYERQNGLNERSDGLSGPLEEAQRSQSGHAEALAAAQKERQAQSQLRDEKSVAFTAVNTQWQDLREQKSSHDARLKSLRELRDNYEGFAAGVKSVMKSKQEGLPHAKGVIGPVGDLLSTDDAYRRAIEAALGGGINNIVTQKAEDAKSSISFLKETKSGRVTFLPLDTIRTRGNGGGHALESKQGVIGKALSHVHCEAIVLPAIEHLLQNTLIVETIDDAIRIARGGGRFPRLVTLDGEMVSSSGAVTGGRTRHDKSGLLGRSAEIEGLEASVASAGERLETLQKEGQTLTGQLQTLEEAINALAALEAELGGKLSKAGVEVARYTTELENLHGTIQQLAEERDTLAAKRGSLEAQRDQAQHKVRAVESDDEALRRKNADVQEVASKARHSLSLGGEGLADLRVSMASITQNIEESVRNKRREEREHALALQESEARAALRARLKTAQSEHEAKIADSVERSKALSETKDEAHAKVLESQKEQQELLEKIKAASNTLKTLREQAAAFQKEVHALELELSHKEDRVQFFQERILAEYNLALASLDESGAGTDEYSEEEREKLIDDHRKQLQRLGAVNLMAIEEYETLEQRDNFLTTQEEDLSTARETLLSVVERIDNTIREMFLDTFNTVGENFKTFFRRLFNGGQARIYLLDEDDPLESGIEIEARPPGKKPQTISLLSGGEQALTAIALLFGIFKAKPSPFCVLDEVDAPLDDANIGRFLDLVDDFTSLSQFIIITHSKRTMGHADVLFGVTQQERGVSQLVSVHLDEVKDANTAA